MRIIWSAPALDDLRGMDDWLVREASPDIALRMLTAVRHRARFLERFPRGGRPIADDHRILRVYETPYLIRYRIIDAIVEIIRVHHEREDWQLDP